MTNNKYLRRIVGYHPSIVDIKRIIELVAPTDFTVLITGETGTGKELVANALHYLSPRALGGTRQLVERGCAEFTPELIESELFGHRSGAYTGATYTRQGAFVRAHNSTIFIDDIQLLPLPTQAKLLRVLEERRVVPVGTDDPIKVDTRVIVSTNRDLGYMVSKGEFREDLHYRINVVGINLPPLRDRGEDIAVLAKYYCRSLVLKTGKHLELDPEALAMFSQYHWPGNVRELRNVMESVFATYDGEVGILRPRNFSKIYTTLLHFTGLPQSTPYKFPEIPFSTKTVVQFNQIVSDFERHLITGALTYTQGNKRQAARILNMPRTTLIDKMHRFGIQDSENAKNADELSDGTAEVGEYAARERLYKAVSQNRENDHLTVDMPKLDENGAHSLDELVRLAGQSAELKARETLIRAALEVSNGDKAAAAKTLRMDEAAFAVALNEIDPV